MQNRRFSDPHDWVTTLTPISGNLVHEKYENQARQGASEKTSQPDMPGLGTGCCAVDFARRSVSTTFRLLTVSEVVVGGCKMMHWSCYCMYKFENQEPPCRIGQCYANPAGLIKVVGGQDKTPVNVNRGVRKNSWIQPKPECDLRQCLKLKKGSIPQS